MRGPITQSLTNPLQYTMSMTWVAPASAWGNEICTKVLIIIHLCSCLFHV